MVVKDREHRTTMDRIRSVAFAIWGRDGVAKTDHLFAQLGHPDTTAEAKRFLAALNMARNDAPHDGTDKGDLAARIRQLAFDPKPSNNEAPYATGGRVNHAKQEEPVEPTKTCNKCKETKPLTGFNKNRTIKDGYARTCKPCLAEYQKNRKRKTNPTPKTTPRKPAKPKSDKPTETFPENVTPPDQDGPPPAGDLRSRAVMRLSDPPISRLRQIQEVLDVDLEEAVAFCEWVADRDI